MSIDWKEHWLREIKTNWGYKNKAYERKRSYLRPQEGQNHLSQYELHREIPEFQEKTSHTRILARRDVTISKILFSGEIFSFSQSSIYIYTCLSSLFLHDWKFIQNRVASPESRTDKWQHTWHVIVVAWVGHRPPDADSIQSNL